MKKTIALFVPTVEGREANLATLRETTTTPATTVFYDVHFHLMYGYSTCGEAWNEALNHKQIAREAGYEKFDYIGLFADDLVAYDGWASAACNACDEGYIPVPLIYRQDGTIDSCGSKGGGSHYCDYGYPPLPEGSLESWMTVVPFFAADWAEQLLPVGHVHYFSDDWFSWNARKAGIKLSVRRDFRFLHTVAGAGRLGHDRLEIDRQMYFEAGGSNA